MPGFNNGVVWANNVRFDGTQYPGQVTADGQLLIGSTAAPNIRVATLTAGAGVGIANGPGTITISAMGSGTTWTAVSSATNPNALVNSNGYIAKGAPVVVFILPAAAAIGDTFHIAGYGNLWTLTQNALQSISLGALTTTPGVTGSLTATQVKDTIELVCVTANTEFQIINSVGNLTFA